MNFRKDLQILRGVAVSAVVLFHLKIPGFYNGFLGVDVFFVISGFLMAQLHNTCTISEFYIRRAKRILPAYVFVLTATIICSGYIASPLNFDSLYEQLTSALFFTSNFYYWKEVGYFGAKAFDPLLNMWSLSVEVQFYILVPFLYKILRRNIYVLYIFLVATLIACILVQNYSPNSSFFLMPLRLWEFIVGAYFAWTCAISSSHKTNQTAIIRVIFFISLIGAFAYKINPEVAGQLVLGHPSLLALVVVISTGVLISSGLPEVFCCSIFGKFFAVIGNYSYSLYLIHYPTIVILGAYLKENRIDDRVVVFYFCVILIISIGTIFVNYFFEKCNKINLFVLKYYPLLALILFIFAYVINEVKLWDQYEAVIVNEVKASKKQFRCGAFFRIAKYGEIFCPLASSNNPRILLLGNSHADAIKGTFNSIAISNNHTAYFAVSNNLLLDGGLTPNELMPEVVNKKFDAVVLHYNNVYDDALASERLEQFISLLSDHRIPTFLIGPIPTYGFDVPDELHRRKQNHRLDYNDVYAKHRKYYEFVNRVSDLQAYVYDPSILLCPNFGSCQYASSDLRPYYYDNNHLTITGAKQLSPIFLDIFRVLNINRSP